MKHSHIFHSISLDCALQIINAALRKGRDSSMAPLCVVVLDIRGTLKAYAGEDGLSLYRFEIARGKALGALGMGFGGQELERRAAAVPMFVQAVQALTDGNLVPVRGGVLIRNAEGELLGSVGVSGDVSQNDEICAIAGIQNVGLVPDFGGHNA
jgi:uncharacterized protein GlcG (DUF336 family)